MLPWSLLPSRARACSDRAERKPWFGLISGQSHQHSKGTPENRDILAPTLLQTACISTDFGRNGA
jgi:hypothetical protein